MVRGLAIYKMSGEPWTNKEYANILYICEDMKLDGGLSSLSDTGKDFKYIFDDGAGECFMYPWKSQRAGSGKERREELRHMEYEDFMNEFYKESVVHYDINEIIREM